MGLSAKRKNFINEYILCGFNATEAARRAGYKHPNKYGPVLANEPEIKAEIERRLQEAALSADEVLYLLAQQATASATDFIDEHGIIQWRKLKDSGVQVKKVDHTKGKSAFELYDSQSALGLIGKHLGLFTNRHDITTKGESLNDGARYNADERARAVNTLLEALRDTSNNQDGEG